MGIRLGRWIEMAANVAIVLCALFLGVNFFKSHVLRSLPPGEQGPRIGQSVEAPVLYRPPNSRTLMFYLSTKCRPCTESIPLLRPIVAEAAAARVRVVASLIEPDDESEDYLATNRLRVDLVRRFRPGELGIGITPTIVAVGSDGRVVQVWRGRLDEPDAATLVEWIRASK
jgi:hypothetical protein